MTQEGSLTEAQKKKSIMLDIPYDEYREVLIKMANREKPEISVIIPVYNGEKYIGRAIQSALNQSFERMEIIVVDDGSTDNTLNYITQYDRIIVLVKPNGGTGSALNTGIRNAKGKWIKWLSADDEMYPDCLDILYENAKNEDYIYYTNYDIIDEWNNIIGHFDEPNRNNKSIEELKKEMMGNYFGNGSTSFIHKNIFEKIGLFEEMKHSEDYEFMLRALSKGVRMELIPEYTIKYRRHPDQLTNRVGGSLNKEIRLKYG